MSPSYILPKLSSRLCNRLLGRSLRPSLASRIVQASSKRYESTSSGYAKSGQRYLKPLPTRSFQNSNAGIPALPRGFGQETTRIYESPSNTGYFTTVYVVAGGCFLYALVLANDYLVEDLPQGVHWIVRWAFGVSVVFLSGFGTFILLKAVNIVRLIDAVPTANGFQLRTQIRPLVPFLRGKTIVSKPGDVIFERTVPFSSLKGVDPSTFQESNIVVRILKRISLANFLVFLNMRRIFTSERFANLRLNGHSRVYKLDITGTFHQDQRVLDRLFKYTE